MNTQRISDENWILKSRLSAACTWITKGRWNRNRWSICPTMHPCRLSRYVINPKDIYHCTPTGILARVRLWQTSRRSSSEVGSFVRNSGTRLPEEDSSLAHGTNSNIHVLSSSLSRGSWMNNAINPRWNWKSTESRASHTVRGRAPY